MRTLLFALAVAGTAVSVKGAYRAEVSPSAAKWEVTAVRELTNYLDRVALDGRLTVEGAENVVFHVGDTAFARSKDLGSDKLQNEEWVIRSFGRDVVINGGGTRGCLYGVYHFLEDFCDIRWWFDDDEDVPAPKPLAFPSLKKRGKPYFFYRDIYRDRSTSPVFAMRCRLNGNGNSFIPPEYGGGEIYGPPDHSHTFEWFVPWGKYGKEHPEWFSLRGGKRIGGMGQGQLCLTNPELKAFFLTRVEEAIAKGAATARDKGLPAPRLYCLAPNDNRCYCECEKCQKMIDELGHAGYHLTFSNFIAGELGPRHPELIFTFEAYHESSDVPKVAMRAADNVIVRLSNTRQNSAAGLFAPENALMRKQTEGWGERAKILSIWEYAVTYQEKTKGFPYPSEFYIPERYRYYAEKGAVSVLIEHEFPDKSDFYDLKFFLERHALEDPFCDGDKLMEEFKDRYFGPAGEKVMASRRYLDKIRRERNGIISWSPNFSEFGFLKLADAEYMTRLYDEAEELVKDDQKRLKRVRRARAGLDRYTVAVRAASAMHAPETGVSDVPFYDFPVNRKTWYLYNRDNPALNFVKDPDACEGLAVEVPGEHARHYYDLPFVLGIDDVIKDVVSYRGEIKAAKPGTGYDWYDFEDVPIPAGGYYVFLTRSWAVRIPAMPPIFCGRRFKVRVRMNFEGPMYGRAGDKNRFRIDRVVFIPLDVMR